MTKRIVIGGASSNVGKTTFTLGLMKAMVKRGLKTQGFKTGPDYIDPAFHTHVTGCKSRNLDSWMLDEESIKHLYNVNAGGKDVSIIEGVMGMYDGFSGDMSVGSTAHLSKILRTPIVLLIDGSGVAASAAAMVLGFSMLDKDVDLAGVVINNVHGEKHYNILKSAIEKYTEVKCFGYLNKNSKIKLESRHLGLIPSVEVETLDEKIDIIASMVEETVDVDAILECASDDKLEVDYSFNKLVLIEENKGKFEGINIGVPFDSSFNFYYQDNFDLFEKLGARITYFSPLKDKEIPTDVDGLYIGGGFPEIFAKELSENTTMISSIKKASDSGMPIYAECGGLMYLLDKIVDIEERTWSLCGLISGTSHMTKRLQRFGYVEVKTKENSIIGNKGLVFKAHEFHRSKVESSENTAYNVVKKRETDETEWTCGYYKENILAAYAHNHFYSNPNIAINLLKSLKKYKND